MYDTMERPPRSGSLQELLFVLVQMRREMAQLMKVRAIVQATKDESAEGEPTQQAFDDYRRALMPYLAQEERDQNDKMRKALDHEFSLGPLRVHEVQASPVVRSRLNRIAKNVGKEPTRTVRREPDGSVSVVRVAS